MRSLTLCCCGSAMTMAIRRCPVDAITPLADHGVIWLLTPKAGRDGHVEPADIAEAAPTAGFQQTSTVNAAGDRQGT